MDFDRNAMAAVLANLYDGVFFVDQYRRIVYWSEGAEKISGYGAGEVIGSLCHDSDISHLDEEGACACIDTCLFKQCFENHKVQEGDRYMLHKEGHRLLVKAKTVPTFDSNGKPTGAIQIFRPKYTSQASQERFEELQNLALVDELTTLPNRRALEASIKMRLEELSRYGRQFGIMFIDIDHFKSINDKHGHDVGDKALKLAATTLMSSIRPFDMLGRFGGEEFIGILVNVDKNKLSTIVHRARALVEKSVLHLQDEDIDITVSIGATLAEPGETIDQLIKRADGLMYQSKKAGRNRVSIIGAPIVEVDS